MRVFTVYKSFLIELFLIILILNIINMIGLISFSEVKALELIITEINECIHNLEVL